MSNRHWRVPQQEYSGLSKEAKIEGALRFADRDEVVALIKEDFVGSYTIFCTRTQPDRAIGNKHKKMLLFLFTHFAEKYGYNLEGSGV